VSLPTSCTTKLAAARYGNLGCQRSIRRSILGVKFQLSSSEFQLAGLSSHVEFELMPSFGIAHDGSRIVGKPEVIRLLPHRPSIGS